MPLDINNENENNIKFIEKFFDPNSEEYGPVDKNYPDFNYRVRMAELTNFWPYYSEAAKSPSETQPDYEARVNTSGRLFGSQYIILNDIVHHDMDVSGMVIGQDYAGRLPEAMFYIERCQLLEGGKEYEVRPKNLNDENFLVNFSPQVIFPVDLSSNKGYYCYRKTSAVQKNNDKLIEVHSGWEKVAEFSNNDIKNYIAGVDLSDKKKNMGFGFIDSGVSGYSGWTNELMTSYKVLDSGSVETVSDDTYYLRKSRTINYISDPSKTYTLERKVSRASNNSTTNPPAWELVSPQAEFPYTDTELLSDFVTGAVDFKVTGVYEVINPNGSYTENGLDYFQIDLIEDWGKSKQEDYTFRQDAKELSFKGGEALRVVQKGNSYYNPRNESHDILGSLETSFSPNSTGVSGSITGSSNAENFYQLEYQLIPKEREYKKLYYETGTFDSIEVGERVFFNSGASQEGKYTPIETNVFGDSVEELDSRSPVMEEVEESAKEEYIGPSYVSGMFHTIEPEEAKSNESSGVGWSHYSSGEKYLVVPKGGYNGLDFNPKGEGSRSLDSYSAGEIRSTFYQGHQSWNNGDEETQYALTEYRTFDPVGLADEPYLYNKEKEIRISDQALCLGESATELPDKKNQRKVFLLDFEYGSDQIFRNASILNIDSTDGSVGISNLKSNKEEFERKPNLFFEKDYIASVTILATGQRQDHDVSLLKEMISTERASDASVFYLERDVYVDSDLSTQSNFVSPSVFSTGLGGASDPFGLSENSTNPLTRGEEKLYLTETYHKNPKEYPFTDSSYFIKRPNITETFQYNDGFEEKNFTLTNIENETTYKPDYFNCSLNYEKNDIEDYDGYGLLTYRGVSLTSASDITIVGTTLGKRAITFAPLNTGVYYEIQARYTDSSLGWTDVSPAVDVHDGMLVNNEVSIELENSDIFTTSNTNLEIRALEWNKSNITANINAQRVTNESPDSLILKSDGVKFYDESKFEHPVTNTPSPNDISISSITESSGTATATTSTAHSLTTGDAVTISGATPTAYNNSFTVTDVTGDTTFTFSIASGTGNASGTIIGNVLVTVVTDNPIGLGEDLDVMNLDGSADKYLSLASHRSFNIQNGDFSMEFWIKSASGGGDSSYIAQREGAFEIFFNSDNKIQFKVNGESYLTSEAVFNVAAWKHVAISAKYNRSTKKINLSLFVDGLLDSTEEVYYGDLSAFSNSELIIGKGLNAKLYGVRIYIGKSNYTGDFAKPTAPFEKEANPRSYKILKYKSSRKVSTECHWIINKNTFNNVSPPAPYKDSSDPAEPFFMSEWMRASSTTQEMGSRYNRALINYVNGYAYSAPNNPHINKNYEGTPIEKAEDLDPRKEIIDANGEIKKAGNIVFDNYRYIDKKVASSKKTQAAPYLYEYTKGSDLDIVRLRNKGGYDMPLEDWFPIKGKKLSFGEGSRLRITKYVYKLYTKRAVVVGDVGYKNNRGHQSGWAYQLQYSTDGTNWVDVDSSETSQAENIFYNNEYVADTSPDGFNNTSSFNSLPVVLLKSDITKKHKIDAIEFRIRKEQNISLGNSADTGKVLKKLNFLPLEVNVPSSGCLLDMTQQEEYSSVVTVASDAKWAEVKLDKDRTYVLVKNSNEQILEPSNSISVSSIKEEVAGTAIATTGRNISISSIVSPSITVDTITESSGTATVTALAAHSLQTGDIIAFFGAVEKVYNNSFTVTDVTGDTTFTFSIASGTGDASGTIVGKSGTARATTSTAHFLQTGDAVAITGATPGAYNNSFTVTVTGSTTFTFPIEYGTGNATGTIIANIQEAHNLERGDVVTIAGATTSAYNSSFTVAPLGEFHFEFLIEGTPGDAVGTMPVVYRTDADKLKINSLTFEEGELSSTDDNSALSRVYKNDFIKDNFTDLPDGQPVEFKGLTGLRISGFNGHNINTLEHIKTVIGPKPSGLTLNRVEKSYKGKSADSYIRTGEFFGLNFGETKAFITPSVTGSHFDELQGFNSFADQPIDSIENDSVGGLEDSVINFSCKSYTTGDAQISIATGVSGVNFTPLNQFSNSPIITSDITVEEDDAGKTFITSGNLTLISNLTSNASDITVASIHGDLSTDVATTNAKTPFPIATLTAANDIVIIQDSGRVEIVNGDNTESTGIVNIFTGDDNNITLDGTHVSANGGMVEKSNVVFVEHGKINLTVDDVDETIVVDCASDVVLPDGFSDTSNITFINGTKYETKVLSENPSHTIGGSNNKVDYIPKETARKYEYSSNSWSASDVDLVRFNQLNLTNTDFISTDGNTKVHNEDVDVRITGNISDNKHVNIVRNQVDNFDIESDLTDWSTPIIRVYINNVLKHVAPSGSLGVKITHKTGDSWEFEKIKPLILNEIIVSPDDGGKVFSYNGYEESVSMRFIDGSFSSNFKIFLISNQEFLTDINIQASSDNESVKFLNKYGDEISWRFVTPIDKRTLVSISKGEGSSFIIAEEDQSNIYKFNQPSDNSDTRVRINRNEGFSLELPTIDSSFAHDRGFDLVFCNFSEGSCSSNTPVGDTYAHSSNIPSFKSRNYKYINSNTPTSSYENFENTSKITDLSTNLYDGDFVVLDGSIDNPRLRSFVDLSRAKKEHKFSRGKMERDLFLDGEIAKYITYTPSSTASECLFTLRNHELATGQKLVFNCDKVFTMDHYYDATNDDFTGTNSVGQAVKAGESVLIYNYGGYSYNYHSFVWDGTVLKKSAIDLPPTLLGLFGSTFEVQPASIDEPDRIYVHIKNAALDGGNPLPKIYHFGEQDENEDYLNLYGLTEDGEKLLANRIPFSLTIDEEDDVSITKKQTFFVEVVDDNKFKLYKDSSRTAQVTKAAAISLLSDTFYVEDINVGSLNVINLGNSDTTIKNYSEEMDIVSPLAATSETTVHQHSSSVYTSGDAVASGVYFATGWNGASDTLDISDLSQNTVFLSGKFHAKADLSTDTSFDSKYYVNAGLSEVVITNTNGGSLDKLEKNRVYKHTSGGTFKKQDQSSSSANENDIIYYPKNELHVPDRKYLGKNSVDQDYNFVFFKPDEHSDDLKIVLPNDWVNLGLGGKKLAVANLHNRQVTVSNFDGDESFTLNADSVVFMADADDYVGDNKSLFTGDIASDLEGYTIIYDEDVREVSVKKDNVDEVYYITKPSDIILDHSMHHDKKIFIDGPANFLRPYLKSKNGETSYEGDSKYDNGTADPTSFEITNISKDPVDVYVNGEVPPDTANKETMASDGKMYSSQFYSVETRQFETKEDEDVYFGHFTLYRASSDAGSFEYPGTDLDSTKTYNIFGIELPIKLNIYISTINVGDAEKINQAFNLEQDDDENSMQIEAGDYHKIGGIGATDINKLNIVNSAYTDIRISSVLANGDDLSEYTVLQDKVKKVFDESQIAIQDSYSSYEISDTRREISSVFSESFVPRLLGKNKALTVSLSEMVDRTAGSDMWSCLAFGEDFEMPREVVAADLAFQPDLIKITKRDVKTLKKEIVDASLGDAVFGGISFSRSITCTSDPFDIALPHRRLIGDRDFEFILVNASWRPIDVVFPEGVGSGFSIDAGGAKKIKYNSDRTYDGEAVTIGSPAENVLSKGLYSVNLDSDQAKTFLVNNSTTENKPFKVKGADPNHVKIINNTGSDLHVESMGGGSNIVISKNGYREFKSLAASIEQVDLGTVPLVRIRDGAVIVGHKAYADKVILFNSDRISLLDFVRGTSPAEDFFKTDIVPFINDTKFSRYYPTRALGYSGSYTIRNQDSVEKTITSLDPLHLRANGTLKPIGVSCYLFEFILENINGKTAYPNKDYDYIIKDSGDFSCVLYNGRMVSHRRSGLDGTNFYRFDSDGNIKYGVDDYDNEVLHSSDSAEGKPVFKIEQSGTTVTATKGQAYSDQKYQGSGWGDAVPLYSQPVTTSNRRFLYQRFYLNKAAYNNKIIIFKDPFDIIYNTTDGDDYYYSKASGTRLVNISKEASCYVNLAPSAEYGQETELLSEYYMSASDIGGYGVPVVRPKYSLASGDDLQVLRHLADVEATSIGDLKIANVSRGSINVEYFDSSWKVFSSERADFISKTEVKYSEVRKQDKRDWFIRLVDLDVPHLIKDNSYFDEKEHEMELRTEMYGRINVDYNGVRFKFSNIFGTNKVSFQEHQTGFQTIEEYDDPYKFGITLLTNKKGIQKKIFWEKDVSDEFFPVYLKLPWNIPQDVIAYMLSTGHERLTRCLHFNERNGEITLGGIQPDKSYSLESEGLSSYDFVHDATQTIVSGQPARHYHDKDYLGSLRSVAFRPKLVYNNKAYFSGEKIEGDSGLSEYKVSYPYFSTLNVSQFHYPKEDLGDSGGSGGMEEARKEEKEQMQIDISDKEREKGRNLNISTITESSGTATATTSEAHSLQTGSTVTITGATPEAYNDSFEVTVAAAEEGASAEDIATAAATFTFSVDEGTGEASSSEFGEIVANVKDLSPIVFSWDKVTEDSHENDFLSGKVESITTYDASAKHELIQGRKIKDISGAYEHELHKFAETQTHTFSHSYSFEFVIPLKAGFTYTRANSGAPDEEDPAEKIEFMNKAGGPKTTNLELTADEGDTAKITIFFEQENSKRNVERPGFEHKILASLTYNRSDLITAGDTQVKAARISLEPKDSMPFVADGYISSLNEDFASPDADEYIVKSLGNLAQKYKNNEQDEKYQETARSLMSLRDNQVYQSLKNNLGYSFVPTFGITSGRDAMVGFNFNIKRNLRSYKAIRFRLKKLTDRRIIFDDLTKDEKIGDYLTNNADEANLQYNLDTSVNSIAYHDIAHPGGVATMPDSEWKEIELDGSKLVLGQVADGDAIVFKENGDNGKIISGKVYFIRVNEVESIDDEVKYKVDILKIFCNDVDNELGFDDKLKINDDLQATVFNGNKQKYKIVNYFNLDKKDGELDHRGWASTIDKLYYEGSGSLEDLGSAAGSSLLFPIIIGSKKFYLERPVYKDPEDATEFAEWADTIWKKEGGGFNVRANLEMSEVAQTFISDFETPADMGAFAYPHVKDGSAAYWKEEDIFSSVKNLLYRENTPIQMVDWRSIPWPGGYTENQVSVKVNVKLTKGREYRCFFNKADDGLVYSMTINGVDKTDSFCEIFTASTEDIDIRVDGVIPYNEWLVGGDVFDADGANMAEIKGEIEARICIVESAGFVDQTVKVDGDNLEAAGYIEYQIPMLNNDGDRGFNFINPDSFCYTEEHSNIFTRGQKQENLTSKDNDNGLMYDGPMPATIKYIYSKCHTAKELDFYISNDFWNGFIDRFETEDEYGSNSNKTKPTNINFNLQKLEVVDGNDTWPTVASDLTISQEARRGKTARGLIAYAPAEVGQIFRFEITNEEVEYYEDGERRMFSNSLMRVPFSWRSSVFASDISSTENSSRGDVYEHNIGLVENHLLQKSISFPEGGVSRLGAYSYRKKHPNFGFKVPYTRRYMYRLSHSLSAAYVDKVSQGGISRIEITNPGSDYRLAPEVTVASPENGVAAEAVAHIESGKLKFIQVTNNGSNYSDLSKLNTTKFISNNWGKGATVRKEWLIQADKFTYNFTLNETKTVTHDGVKNIVFGSYVSGTGIQPYTKVTKILEPEAGVYKFEISHAATTSGSQSLTIDLRERQMPYISLEDQFGIETADVTLKTVDPAKLHKWDPRYDNPCQESFGIDFEESEAIANYTESDAGKDLAANAVSSLTNYVALVEGATEDPSWLDVKDKASLVGDRSSEENSSSVDSKEISSYGKTTEDEYVDNIKGTEHPSVDGFYTEKEVDETEQTGITVTDDGKCQRETFPSASVGSAKAIVNNQSLAEYRVVENAIANTATPWITSFSREENPSLPKGFGINPGSPLTSEVFNNYARTVNNMSLVGAYVPVFARVRKFRQYEYRYVDDMGGLTFFENNPTDAGGELSGGAHGLDYSIWEGESKINYIDFIDPNDRQYKTAWFSADFGSIVEYNDEDTRQNIHTPTYENGIDLYRAIGESDGDYNGRLQGVGLELKTPASFSPNNDIGLPTIVNIPEELGVFCNPAALEDKGLGIELPLLNNRRASVFGGELVHTSEAYDITDEDGRIVSSIINIAGSDIIDTSYESEIIFGCQIKGKPFWSTFLKTTKEWTEFEIVPSPSFLDSISSEDGMGGLTQLRGTVLRSTTLCSNEEFSKVKPSSSFGNHSVCAGGRNDVLDSAHSYEALFNLREGDSVVGPVENSHEFSFDQSFGGQGIQTFKLEPEFTQALAVYASNGFETMYRLSRGAHVGANPNYKAGPCIHKCSPSARAVFNASDEQLVFDLMAGSKNKTLSATTRMPRLVAFTDPATGEKSYRYE